MSNRRKPRRNNRYLTGYLRSVVWFQRRQAWFNEEIRRNGNIRCVVCLKAGTRKDFDLHHLDYTGVGEGPDGWVAGEPHDDLVAVHPAHHEAIHRLIDRDEVLRGMVGRRAANLQAIARLRAKIIRLVREWSQR